MLISLFSFFSDGNNIDYDESGIVHDVRASTNGYVFYIDGHQDTIRCFFKERPVEYGHYAVLGEYSSDGGIFFIDRMFLIDEIINDE